jgi:hypothetical protein
MSNTVYQVCKGRRRRQEALKWWMFSLWRLRWENLRTTTRLRHNGYVTFDILKCLWSFYRHNWVHIHTAHTSYRDTQQKCHFTLGIRPNYWKHERIHSVQSTFPGPAGSRLRGTDAPSLSRAAELIRWFAVLPCSYQYAMKDTKH